MKDVYLLAHKILNQIFGMEQSQYYVLEPKSKSVAQAKIEDLIKDHFKEKVAIGEVFVVQDKNNCGIVDISSKVKFDVNELNPFYNEDIRVPYENMDSYLNMEGTDRIVVANKDVVYRVKLDIERILGNPVLRIVK